jgi:hypothetical protein
MRNFHHRFFVLHLIAALSFLGSFTLGQETPANVAGTWKASVTVEAGKTETKLPVLSKVQGSPVRSKEPSNRWRHYERYFD